MTVQDRFSVGGAYRNPTSNRVSVLSRYELRSDRALGAPAGMGITRRVQSVSTHVDLEPARKSVPFRSRVARRSVSAEKSLEHVEHLRQLRRRRHGAIRRELVDDDGQQT